MILKVNGANDQANVTDGSTALLWVLRDVLGLTGTKYGCGIEVCGACTVLISGQREHACVFDVSSAVGENRHHRRPFARRQPPGAEGLGEVLGAALRLLPERHDHVHGRGDERRS